MKAARRGLFRLWLVGTIIWAALIFLAGSGGDTRPEAAMLVVEGAFVPPVIVLVIGAILLFPAKRR